MLLSQTHYKTLPEWPAWTTPSLITPKYLECASIIASIILYYNHLFHQKVSSCDITRMVT